jgi:pyrroloquinoline quinone (PQQ) biosynthesis protein C
MHVTDSTFRNELRHLASTHPLFQRTHPFWRDCFRGRLPAEALHVWARDIYPFVRDFPWQYLHVAVKCRSVPALTGLCETIFEETGCGRLDQAHSELFKRFMLAMGMEEADARETPVTEEGRAFWRVVTSHSREGTFLEALTCVGLGVERPLPKFFPMVARALERHYGLDAASVEFFSVHSVADVKHSQLAAKLVAEEARTHADQARVKEIIFDIWNHQLAHLDALHERFPSAEPAHA